MCQKVPGLDEVVDDVDIIRSNQNGLPDDLKHSPPESALRQAAFASTAKSR